jgi:hypothetical protein
MGVGEVICNIVAGLPSIRADFSVLVGEQNRQTDRQTDRQTNRQTGNNFGLRNLQNLLLKTMISVGQTKVEEDHQVLPLEVGKADFLEGFVWHEGLGLGSVLSGPQHFARKRN